MDIKNRPPWRITGKNIAPTPASAFRGVKKLPAKPLIPLNPKPENSVSVPPSPRLIIGRTKSNPIVVPSELVPTSEPVSVSVPSSVIATEPVGSAVEKVCEFPKDSIDKHMITAAIMELIESGNTNPKPKDIAEAIKNKISNRG